MKQRIEDIDWSTQGDSYLTQMRFILERLSYFRVVDAGVDPSVDGYEAPVGAIIVSEDGNGPWIKTSLGSTAWTTVTPSGSTVAGSEKTMQNTSGIIIPAGRPIAKLSDGGISQADSDAVTKKIFIGVSKVEIGIGVTGKIALVGQNVVNAIAGLGFSPGDQIYLFEDGTYTNDINDFTNDDDDIIRVGIADCEEGTASVIAKDLIMFSEVIYRKV